MNRPMIVHRRSSACPLAELSREPFKGACVGRPATASRL